ncbi:Nnf2p RNJ42_01014 [Nakaseomyces bracarensis]|uniref:Nnf2p n=1 Tax=Nakaseomyces bracarensis TaxID=273131 RepID=UPI003871F7DE
MVAKGIGRNKENLDVEVVTFAKNHRFKDTLALFLVFLSFNHTLLFLLLTVFVVAMRMKNALANSFIVFFLSKKPSADIQVVNRREIKGWKYVGPPFLSVVYTVVSRLHRLMMVDWLNKSSVLRPLPGILLEYLATSVLITYGGSYFSEPVENFTIAIVASFLINDPNNCLTQAMLCSVLYSTSNHIVHNYLPKLLGKTGYRYIVTISSSGASSKRLRRYILSNSVVLRVLSRLFQKFNLTGSSGIESYLREPCLFLSFHILIFVLNRRYTAPVYEEDCIRYEQEKLHRQEAKLVEVKTPTENHNKSSQRVTSGSSLKGTDGKNTHTRNRANSLLRQHARSVSSSNNNVGSNNNGNGNINNNNNGNSNSINIVNSGSNVSNGISNVVNASVTEQAINTSNGSKWKNNAAMFSNVVSQYQVFEPNIASPLKSNRQSVANGMNSRTTINGGDNNTEEAIKNEFYDLRVDFDVVASSNKLLVDITPTTNIENFIRQLFQKKNRYLIPPLWSMFLTVKTANLERKYLERKYENVLTPIPSARDNSNTVDSDDKISVSGEDAKLNQTAGILENGLKKSVFDEIPGTVSTAMIVQNTDDYRELNLVSTRDNIFNRGDNDYKVCIERIGGNFISFHIENLFEGELIVLINGVIWSEVSCSLVMEHEGEEYAVVNGLAPSCSYDMQFINRLHQSQDHLMADIIVRTAGNDSEDVDYKRAYFDFTFPSYYHRKFLSPLLTLQQSVLTTNTNLAEERMKLKKTKKEISKKLSSLRQEIDHFRTKISNSASTEEKGASKVEALKTTLQQSNNTIQSLEEELKDLTEKQIQIEEKYLEQKDLHLRRQLEFSKEDESYKTTIRESDNRIKALKEEATQLDAKLIKLNSKNEKLAADFQQQNDLIENFVKKFLTERENARVTLEQQHSAELNEYELLIKGLEQDIDRVETENREMIAISS